MKNRPASSRGRPQKAETTELVSALIERQVALAARTVAKINHILDTHVRRADAARAWVEIEASARRTLLEVLPARVHQKLPNIDIAVVKKEIEQALSVLVVSDEDRALAALPPQPAEPRAVMEPVSNLAAARAQTARLQARLMSLKQRIVPTSRWRS